MKYKMLGFLIATIAIMWAYNIKVEAKTASEYENIFIFWDNTYDYYNMVVCDTVPTGEYYYSYNNMDIINIYTNSGAWYSFSMSNPDMYVNYLNEDVQNQNYSAVFNCYRYLKVIKGSFGGYVPNYAIIPEPEPEPEPSWWESMWDWFAEDMGKPLGFLWFKDLIESVFGDDSEGTISENVTLGNPTLAPTPTPIPYTTVVIPKTDVTTGDTYYETNYYYVNPSGTPIITSSPPTNSPSNNGGGNGNQTYNPIDGKPYSIPRLDWMTSVDIDGNGYDGIDSIADGMSSIDDIGSEYTDGMSAVQDASGTLPTSWLLLIGIVASIPLLAGIVSRFLGG